MNEMWEVQKAVFRDVDQAVGTLLHLTKRLAMIVGWLVISVAHLAVLTAILVALWATQTTPADALGLYRDLSASKPIAVAGALGVSAIGVAAGYWKLVRWMHRSAHGGWLLRYLMRGL